MTKDDVIIRLREKLCKLMWYNAEAHKQWGPEVAKELFLKDLEFYSTLIALIGIDKEKH